MNFPTRNTNNIQNYDNLRADLRLPSQVKSKLASSIQLYDRMHKSTPSICAVSPLYSMDEIDGT